MVESQPSKLLVAGSIPVSRSSFGPGTSSPDPYRRRSRGPLRSALRSGVARRWRALGELEAGNWELGTGSDKASDLSAVAASGRNGEPRRPM